MVSSSLLHIGSPRSYLPFPASRIRRAPGFPSRHAKKLLPYPPGSLPNLSTGSSHSYVLLSLRALMLPRYLNMRREAGYICPRSQSPLPIPDISDCIRSPSNPQGSAPGRECQALCIPPGQAVPFPWQEAPHTDIPHQDFAAHGMQVHYRTGRFYL